MTLTSDDSERLATLLHGECKCVPQNNGGGDCDWCAIYYGTTDLVEVITAVVGDLRDEVSADNILLKGRAQLMAEVPDCPMHGPDCIPHGVDFIKDLKLYKARFKWIIEHRPCIGVSAVGGPEVALHGGLRGHGDTYEKAVDQLMARHKTEGGDQ